MKTANRLFLVALSLMSLSVVGPVAQAVVPPPDGGYPNFTTAEGTHALQSFTTGAANTAVGWYSLGSLTTGNFNTATGAGSLLFNTADQNTGFGAAALLLNTTGTGNTANGASALLHNDTGSFNTAAGNLALSNNTTGTFNSGFGQGALASNTIGANDTASGAGALFNNTLGNGNTANGFQALNFNIVGSANTAIGYQALLHTTGDNNIALGAFAGVENTAGDFNIDIGNLGGAGDSNTIRIGDAGLQFATFIAGISGVNQGSATAVFINTVTGQLGTTPPASSRRFKKEIQPMDETSEAILGLKPVTFHYKIDSTGTPQFGLIAEEVAEVNPDLVVRDENGEIYTVRYEAVNAMLLNEFLKEHKAFVQEQHNVEKLEATVATLVATVKEQAAQIQKVSAQFHATKFATGRIRGGGPALQMVNNP
jgi:hypothetical protein